MALTKPPVIPVWADAGDKTQPTDTELHVGWPVSNIPPARQRFNWFFNFCANAVRYLTRRGIPDWAADETYLVSDRVQWTDGATYVSLANANINYPPGSNPGVWAKWGYTSVDMSAYAPINSPALTGNPTAPTPSPGDNDTSIATTEFVQASVAAGTISDSKLYFMGQL